MTTFPLLCLPMITELLFLSAKFGRMGAPATIHLPAWDELVQHLVIHDVFDNILRHEGLIKERMDAN
jgi:hypothetical protein